MGDRFMTNRERRLDDAERKIVEDNLGLVGFAIQKHFRKYIASQPPNGESLVGYRDLFAAGVFGLIECLDRFDPKQGAFSTCANFWIVNKIYRWLRERGYQHVRVPKWVLHAQRNGELSRSETRHLEQVQGVVQINDEIDTHAPEGKDPSPKRRALLALAYSIPATGLAKIGRVVFIKVGSLDGGTGMSHKELDAFAAVAPGLGLTPGRAKRAFDAFIDQLRSSVQDADRS